MKQINYADAWGEIGRNFNTITTSVKNLCEAVIAQNAASHRPMFVRDDADMRNRKR